MNKSLLYRLFGLGSIPSKHRAQIDAEGIVLCDEGLRGSITFREFRSPGRFSGWRRNWFTGSIVLTQQHFLAFKYGQPVIGVAWADHRIDTLRLSVDGDRLLVAFDASTFRDDWSGKIEVRFRTRLASALLEHIERMKSHTV